MRRQAFDKLSRLKCAQWSVKALGPSLTTCSFTNLATISQNETQVPPLSKASYSRGCEDFGRILFANAHTTATLCVFEYVFLFCQKSYQSIIPSLIMHVSHYRQGKDNVFLFPGPPGLIPCRLTHNLMGIFRALSGMRLGKCIQAESNLL
jgi:hypothetical protein